VKSEKELRSTPVESGRVEQVIAVLQSEGRDSFRLIARHFVRPQAEHWHDNTVIQRHSKRKARRNLGGV